MGIIYFFICLCVLHAMITDVICRRIYNYNSVLIIISSLSLYFYSVQFSFLIPFIVLTVGFFLFLFNVWGAGDAKFCFALTLSLPSDLIFPFFLVMSISGGGIAIFMLIFPWLRGKHIGMPYGLPIGIGYLSTLYMGILNESIIFI